LLHKENTETTSKLQNVDTNSHGTTRNLMKGTWLQDLVLFIILPYINKSTKHSKHKHILENKHTPLTGTGSKPLQKHYTYT